MSCPKILAKFHKQVNLYESTANANMTFSSSTKHNKYILKTLYESFCSLKDLIHIHQATLSAGLDKAIHTNSERNPFILQGLCG